MPNLEDCWNKIGVQGDKSCPQLQKHAHCRNCPVYSDAAVQFLDRELPPGCLEDWTRHLAGQKKVSEAGQHAVAVFRIGAEWLALPVKLFVAVVEMKPVHSLPHRRSPVVEGLVNIRGELLVCMSLSRAIGIQPGPDDQSGSPKLLVVNRDGSRFVFQVDEIHGIRRYRQEELQEIPGTVAISAGAHTTRLLPWEGKSIGLLDEERLFHTWNRSLA